MIHLSLALLFFWLVPSISYRPLPCIHQNKIISLKNGHIQPEKDFGRKITSLLQSSMNDGEQQSGMKGMYRRPSKAVEQGGGFFIPGLEDGKIRILSGVDLLVLIAVNHNGAEPIALAQSVSELTSIACALYLFLQGVLPATSGSSSSGDAGSQIFLTNLQAARSSTARTSPPAPVAPAPLEALNPTTAEAVARLVSRTTAGVFYILATRTLNDGKAEYEVLTELGPVSSDSVRRWSESLSASNDTLNKVLTAVDEVAKSPVGSDSAVEIDIPALRLALSTIRGGPTLPEETAYAAYVSDPRGYRWLLLSKQRVEGLKFIGRVCRL